LVRKNRKEVEEIGAEKEIYKMHFTGKVREIYNLYPLTKTDATDIIFFRQSVTI